MCFSPVTELLKENIFNDTLSYWDAAEYSF